MIDEVFDGWAWAKNGNNMDYARFFKTEIGGDNEIIGGEADMTWAQFDLTATVKRGQNAPSIIMWSIGNEVQEGAGSLNQQYADVQADLIRWAQELDTTKLVTRGDNVVKGNTSGTAYDIMNTLAEAGGVVGLNYTNGSQYDSQHAASPDWIIYVPRQLHRSTAGAFMTD